MLKKKIIGRSITNLTDARYFAAWGVDFIGFNADNLAVDIKMQATIKEMIDWIEGPNYVAEISTLAVPDGFFDVFFNMGFQSIALGPFTNIDFLPTGIDIFKHIDIEQDQEFGKYENVIIGKSEPGILNSDYLDLLEDLSNYHNVFIDINKIENSIEELAQLPIEGFSISGGEEEKVGLKSYDELDEIFEFLEIQE
jgi:phosphoribosylanthranilate isomerase